MFALVLAFQPNSEFTQGLFILVQMDEEKVKEHSLRMGKGLRKKLLAFPRKKKFAPAINLLRQLNCAKVLP